jgi:hypothetical protein
MRLIPCCLVIASLIAAGCNKNQSSQSVAPATNSVTGSETDTLTITPRTVTTPATPAATTGQGGATAAPPVEKSVKPLADRSTDELLADLEKPDQKEHLPLIADLASRPKDREKVLPAMMKLQVDGRYIVRVAAATARVALDSDHPGKYATTLDSALRFRHQAPVYGALVEDAPELRKIQKLAVPGLVKVIERELGGDTPKEGPPETPAALQVLRNFPLDAGKPAVAVVARVAAHKTHPSRVLAQEVLKTWGAAN